MCRQRKWKPEQQKRRKMSKLKHKAQEILKIIKWNKYNGAAAFAAALIVQWISYNSTPFFCSKIRALSTESTPVLFLIGANSFSRTTSNGRQVSII